MREQAEELKERTKKFALQGIRCGRTLPQTEEARVLGKQLLRSATSVAANYRSVCRARSRTEFVARMGIGVEEADETSRWFELLSDGGVLPADRVRPLMGEADELLAIFTASLRTSRANLSMAKS